MAKRTGKTYGPRHEQELRQKLETAKMNRRHFEKKVKRHEAELAKAQTEFTRAAEQAQEAFAILYYGLGKRDVKL